MRTIVVGEGKKFRLPSELRNSRFAERLLRISELSPFPIFRWARGDLQAAPVVGTVTCGSLRIEIRPKTSSGEDAQDRSFLLNLLRYSDYLSRYRAARGWVPDSNGDPIDALVAEIVDDIAICLHDGIPRRYEMMATESPTIRGRIDFTRLSTNLLCKELLIPLRYAPLTIDNSLARLIKWTVLSLLQITRSVRIRERLSGLLILLSSVEMTGFSRADVDRITLSRFEMQWKRTLIVARQLIRNRSLDPTVAGNLDGTAFVFPLERLFERCLRRLLSSSVAIDGITVSHRTDNLFMLESAERQRGALRIRPDFVYRRDDRPIALADAKWKLLTQRGRTHGLDRADVYQMCAYLMRYHLREGFLFFPKTNWMTQIWSDTYVVPGTMYRIHLIGIDVEALVSSNYVIRDRALDDLRRVTTTLMAAPAGAITTS